MNISEISLPVASHQLAGFFSMLPIEVQNSSGLDVVTAHAFFDDETIHYRIAV